MTSSLNAREEMKRIVFEDIPCNSWVRSSLLLFASNSPTITSQGLPDVPKSKASALKRMGQLIGFRMEPMNWELFHHIQDLLDATSLPPESITPYYRKDLMRQYETVKATAAFKEAENEVGSSSIHVVIMLLPHVTS